MNDTVTITCPVCGKLKNYSIDACIKVLVESLGLGLVKDSLLCSVECREVLKINPLPYEKLRFDTKDKIIELTGLKYGIV